MDLRNWIKKIACQPVAAIAGCCGVAAYVRTDKCPSQDWQTVSILTKRLVAFDCTLESSRILLFWSLWTSEEAPCISQQLLILASLLMLRGSSEEQIYSSHLICNSVVYLCAKFGALNPRINKMNFGGNWFQTVPQVQTSRFSIQTIFWLSDLVSMFP